MHDSCLSVLRWTDDTTYRLNEIQQDNGVGESREGLIVAGVVRVAGKCVGLPRKCGTRSAGGMFFRFRAVAAAAVA